MERATSRRGSRASVESTTTRTPGTVSEDSATFVATTTRRRPSGLGARAASWALAGRRPCSGRTSTFPGALARRRETTSSTSRAPGRKTSTSPERSARARSTVTATWARNSRGTPRGPRRPVRPGGAHTSSRGWRRPGTSTSGAAPSDVPSEAPPEEPPRMRRRRSASSVADMATRVRSSRRAARASARRARSRSLSKERSWTSSRMTALTPLSSGSRWRRRRRSPAVTTSIRVSGPARRSPRTAYPTVPPTSSPRRLARRRAAARAAMRRGWVTTTRPGRRSWARPGVPARTSVRTSARSGGTSVVLPVPGGAVRTRQAPAPASSEAEGLGERRSRSSGSTSTTGRSGGEASSALMGSVCGGCVRPCGPVRVMPRLCPVGEWTGQTSDRGGS